ncbi:unnamed protein product [Leuciscus chuanchicus]
MRTENLEKDREETEKTEMDREESEESNDWEQTDPECDNFQVVENPEVDPFGAHLYTETGIGILVDNLRDRSPVTLYLDATGSVISKIPNQTKPILYYALTLPVSFESFPGVNAKNAESMPPAKLEAKEWTILHTYLDISGFSDDLFCGADELFTPSTPDPTPLPLMTPEPVIAHVTAPDPVLPPVTPLPVLVPNGQAHSPAPPSEPTNRPPMRGPCGAKCRRQCSGKFSEDRRQEIWSEYWNMRYAQKRAFIFASVSQVPTEKVCANASRQRSSHYRREHAPFRRYLPSDVTVKLMFADFIEKGNRCSYETYRKTVKSKNISFTKLGEEECECCLLQDQHVRCDHQGEAAENCPQCERWHKHQTEAAETRLHYRSDADKDWPENTSVRSVDLQKVIMLPRMPGVKSAVFTRRISTYHETFASVGKKLNKRKTISIVWHEGIAGRNAKEITSAYAAALEKERDIRHVIYWVDNCNSQNKNWCLFTSLLTLVNSETISAEDVTLKFFEPGHTFMSADSFHHGVEQEMRHRPGGVVFDFDDFLSVVANSNSRKVEVVELKNDDIRAWMNGHSAAKTKKMPRLAELKVVQLRRGSRSMFVKKSHGEEDFIELDFLQKKFIPCIPTTLRQQDWGVEEAKKTEILKNLVPLMPPTRRIERLPHGGGRTGMFSPQQETLIVDMVRENNAVKLSEIQQKIIEDHVNFEGINSVSLSTVDRVFKRNRLRMKPLYRVPFDRNSDSVKEQRFQYVQRVFQLDAMKRPHEFIYMDEAGFNLTKRRRGRNVIGHRAIVGVPGQPGGNVTLCAAISNHGVVHHHANLGPNNTHQLLIFLNHMRDALLGQQDEHPIYVVVWDNVSFHRALQVREWFNMNQGFINLARGFLPRCLARQNVACDVDEVLWPDPVRRHDAVAE